MTIEDILSETGGFGRFQLFILLGVGLNRFTIGWSMLQMSYAGIIPDWLCLHHNGTELQNASTSVCFTNNNNSNHVQHVDVCDKFHFVGSAVTIINEWNLVCSLSWVKAAITSIQMSGVLVGALVAGQIGDSIGRKKTLYIFVLEHAVLNFITAFSVTWQMFAVCRFFIGLGLGGVLVSGFPYSLEVLPLKWRPLVSILPIWSVGVCVFALASWLMMNWSHLHITCGVLSLTGLLGYIYIPESLRWLTVHSRMEEARDVVMKIAIINHKLQPRKASVSLQAIAWKEQKAHDSNKRYTYIDVFRERITAQTSFVFCFHWFSLALAYYGLTFNVSAFASSIYINIFILAVVEIPAILSTFYFDNKIGRKWTSIISIVIACVPLLICLIIQAQGTGGHNAAVITFLCLVAKMGLGAAWAVGETWCSEFYPTVTRCLGLGVVHAAASIGGLITPFIINLNDAAVASFTIMSCLLMVDIFICLLGPETKDLELADTPTNVTAVKKLTKDLYGPTKNNESVEGCDRNMDNVDISEDGISLENEKTTREMIEEGAFDNKGKETDVAVIIEKEALGNEVGWGTSNYFPKIKQDNVHLTEVRVTEFDTEKDLSTPSPGSSPTPSPQIKRLDKKKIGELFHVKSSNKSPKIKRDKAKSTEVKVVESNADNVLPTPSPGSSPASSPKIKKFDKIKSGEFFNGKIPNLSPKIKREKINIPEVLVEESQTEKGLSTPSPGSSPVPSPKIKRFEKIKSGEFFHGKASNDSPQMKRDKMNTTEMRARDSQTEKGLSTPSPSDSPAPSPKIKRFDKIMSGEFFHGKASNDSPKMKRDKMNTTEMRARDSQTEKGLSTPSPSDSPAPSPKIKRFDKIMSGEFLHGKSKSKQKDDSPPYIESSRNKNVRFSIY